MAQGVSFSLYIGKRRLKIFYKNGKNVGMAQKGQKQEGMSCGEVFAVCGFYTLGYCTISLHLAAFCIICATHCMAT